MFDRRDLICDPLYRPEHLGAPIPASPHAVSVCLPTWSDNVGYEEADPRVLAKLSTGYPRFVYNRFCRELFAVCDARYARADETCLVFPTGPAAGRFAAAMQALTTRTPRVVELDADGAAAAIFLQSDAAVAKSLWQHCGEGISSRQAQACLENVSAIDGAAAKQALRERIARLAGSQEDDVFLFPCGMSAIYHLHRALATILPQRKTVQFGFPYVDTLKIQQKLGPGAHFFPCGDRRDLQRLAALLEQEPIAGLLTEFPSNPLLVSPDLEALAALAQRHEFPLIVDDTLAGFANVDILSAADVLCTSLTKFFSGVGDVTGGALVLNRSGRFYDALASGLRGVEDTIWAGDALVLERNSRGYDGRVGAMNRSAEAVADFLREHPKVHTVFYPKFQTREHYDAFRRPAGGYGGLMSVFLHDAPRAAPPFFDALRVCKGPNLGMDYTLACPYTILAHYQELDFAESCGVSPFLVRVSIGIEAPDELIRRFAEALDHV